MTKIVCETATLADAVAKAARVAPSKGSAFDKAAGVMLEVRPDKPSPLYVKATDLEVTYLQRVSVIEAEGVDANWRLPSALAAGVMGSLPLGAGQNVTLSDDNGVVKIESGRKVATIRLIASEAFPAVKPFDPSGMATVDGIAHRIEQAAWCTDADHPILNGIHIDGETVVSCDRINMVSGPCVVPVQEPITVPLRAVATLLRNVGPIKMRATDKRLELMPDDDTQIACTLLQGAYPEVHRIRRDEFGGTIKINRSVLSDAVNAMLVLVRGERYPYLHVHIEPDSMELDMEVSETGKMEDVISASGGTEMDLWFTPQNLLNAISHAGNDEVEISYGPGAQQPVRILDGRGYEFWGMPLRAPTTAPPAPTPSPEDA